jgi:hypothetical protein
MGPERARCPTCRGEGEAARCGRCEAPICAWCTRPTHCPRCAFAVVREVLGGRRVSAGPGDAKVTHLLLGSSDADIRIHADGFERRCRRGARVDRYIPSTGPAVVGHLMDRAGLLRITEPTVTTMRSAPIRVLRNEAIQGPGGLAWSAEGPPAGWSTLHEMTPPDYCAWFIPGPDEIRILLREQRELRPAPQMIPPDGPLAAIPLPPWSRAEWEYRDDDPPRRCPHCERVAARYRVLAIDTLVCLGCGRSFEVESGSTAAG